MLRICLKWFFILDFLSSYKHFSCRISFNTWQKFWYIRMTVFQKQFLNNGVNFTINRFLLFISSVKQQELPQKIIFRIPHLRAALTRSHAHLPPCLCSLLRGGIEPAEKIKNATEQATIQSVPCSLFRYTFPLYV